MVKPKWARRVWTETFYIGLHSLLQCLFLQPLFYHTERNDNCTFYAWEGSFLSSNTHFNIFMAVFNWILRWCQFTPPGVPIHPTCANSLRTVVNFIFFNKTKTEVGLPEVLKMYMWIELLCIALTHICYNLQTFIFPYHTKYKNINIYKNQTYAYIT